MNGGRQNLPAPHPGCIMSAADQVTLLQRHHWQQNEKALPVGYYACDFSEEDRQMILLALHKLRQERPGWDYALGEIEKQLGGQIEWPATNQESEKQ